ncbi:DUF3168 domain-containing protein [Phenylobacterium sp.]|uniref:tail completion protein gp17 n=1 Tax=Phenylobacterium sp. TaxID=1871053 RepID=UPI0027369443|nr:DUF3168 domain-containing protein [Phenylobacterium sp.]MDP3853619.1 DUF3168 domain-containing protein [Phenylobacterium sp.]
MEEDLIAFLLAASGVAAMVTDRIDWNALPQGGAIPAITLHRITGGHGYTMRGRSSTTGALVQADCWGGTYAEAKLTARAVIAACDDPSNPRIQGAFIEDDGDAFEVGDGPQPDGSTEFHNVRLQIRIWHNAAP